MKAFLESLAAAGAALAYSAVLLGLAAVMVVGTEPTRQSAAPEALEHQQVRSPAPQGLAPKVRSIGHGTPFRPAPALPKDV